MRYNPEPPYNVLQTDRITFGDMQRMYAQMDAGLDPVA